MNNADAIIARHIANHAADCTCSVCKIVRSCDEMQALTIKTNKMIVALGGMPVNRPEARGN